MGSWLPTVTSDVAGVDSSLPSTATTATAHRSPFLVTPSLTPSRAALSKVRPFFVHLTL